MPDKDTKHYAEKSMAKTRKRKPRRNVTAGIVHIRATFNNTTVTITDTILDIAACTSTYSVKYERQ